MLVVSTLQDHIVHTYPGMGGRTSMDNRRGHGSMAVRRQVRLMLLLVVVIGLAPAHVAAAFPVSRSVPANNDRLKQLQMLSGNSPSLKQTRARQLMSSARTDPARSARSPILVNGLYRSR